jgi:hypothetical protein
MSQELSFSDESLISKSVPKFRFQDAEKSSKKCILFLSQKLIKEAVHNIPENGYVKCLSVASADGTTQDCPACSNPATYKKARYGMHILEYTTDHTGKPLKPLSFQVKMLPFAKSTAEKLQTLFQSMGEQFTKMDVLVTCESPKYQTINFTPLISGPSLFSQLPEADKAVQREEIKKQILAIDVSKEIAREVDSTTMSDMLSGKIKLYPEKKVVDAAAQPQAPAVTSAQAALPLTQTSVAATIAEATPHQRDAKAMMDGLSI